MPSPAPWGTPGPDPDLWQEGPRNSGPRSAEGGPRSEQRGKVNCPIFIRKETKKGRGVSPALNDASTVTQRAWRVQALRCGHGPLGWARAYLQSPQFHKKGCRPVRTATHPSFFMWLSSASSGPHVVGTDPARIPHGRETGQLGGFRAPGCRRGLWPLRCPCSHHPRPCHSPKRTPGSTSPELPEPAGKGSPSSRWLPTGRKGWPTVQTRQGTG